jgi:hypothetical protein
MRKLRVSILLTIVALFMLAAIIKPTQPVKASFREYTIAVYAGQCSIGPWPPYGTMIGFWTYDCVSYSGSGEPPGHSCTYWETAYGNACE